MAAYNVHGGHNKIVPGAAGYLDEVTEDRKITAGVLALLKEQGHTVYDCTDDSGRTAGANLSNIVAKCNAHTVALDISIHLNAAKKDPGDGRTKGVEVFVYDKNSKAYAAAERVCRKISALGFTNRGVKTSTSLYVLKHTHSPAMLIEVVFVDDKDDADRYRTVGVNAVCKAIAEGILDRTISTSGAPAQNPKQASPPVSTPVSRPASASGPAAGTGYKTGALYTLKADALRVRTGAGTNFRAKTYHELSANARKHAYANGTLKKGTKVTCQSVKIVNGNVWMKIPSGWIAARYGGKMYVG